MVLNFGIDLLADGDERKKVAAVVSDFEDVDARAAGRVAASLILGDNKCESLIVSLISGGGKNQFVDLQG